VAAEPREPPVSAASVASVDRLVVRQEEVVPVPAPAEAALVEQAGSLALRAWAARPELGEVARQDHARRVGGPLAIEGSR